MNVLQRLPPRMLRFLKRCWAVFWRALIKYNETDGEQRAASFAYYAFFSLFPLVLLLISIGAAFIGDQEFAARKVVEFVGQYIPVEPGMANVVIGTLNGVIKSRNSAGAIAFLVLGWSAIRFFQALVRGVNRAWGTKEYAWWRLPIQNLLMVGVVASAFFLGIFAPPTIDLVEYYYWQTSWTIGLDFAAAKDLFQFCRLIVPTLVLFYGLSIFYRAAPRRRTKFREVWIAALLVTGGLQGLQRAFVLYTTNISDFNRLYGTLGSVVALLVWIYLSGSLIIFGGCLSAAQWEVNLQITDQSEPSTAR